MTFHTGESTWGAITDLIIDLATGAVAGGNGLTTAVAERWRRPVVGATLLAPPAASDIAVTEEHRAGYWLRWDDNSLYNEKPGTAQQYCRAYAACTGVWPTTYQAAFCTLKVDIANTVANDYSNARIILGGQWFNATTYTWWSTGNLVTLDINGRGSFASQGVTFYFELKNPEDGILKVGDVSFTRVFTEEFRGGIDYWRGAAKTPDGVFTFTNLLAPPGVAGTDYAVNAGFDHKIPNHFPLVGTTSYFQTPGGQYPPFAPMTGLGIKTDAGLTGARYEVNFKRNEGLCRLSRAGMVMRAHWGGTALDHAGTFRYYGLEGDIRYPNGNRVADGHGNNFLQPFTVAPLDTHRVQYWISVTADRIAIALNGDSAAGGVVTLNQIAYITPDEPVNDSGSWFIGYMVDNTNNYYQMGHNYLVDLVSKKGYRDGGRDWQTGWGRCDFFVFESSAWWTSELGFCWWSQIMRLDYMFPVISALPFPYITDRAPTSVAAKQNLLSKWPMVGLTAMDYGNVATEANHSVGLYRPRGNVKTGFYMVPRGQFANGDEVLDNATGKKYTLFIPSAYSSVAGSTYAYVAMEQV